MRSFAFSSVLLVLCALGVGCSPEVKGLDAAALSAALEIAKSEVSLSERLAACDRVLTITGCTAAVPVAGRIPMLVALGIKGWLREQAGEVQGASECRKKHRELARELVHEYPSDSDCRSHAAQLHAQDGDYDAAWGLLLAAATPKDAAAQETLLKGASLVHALHYERGETALELKSLRPYAEVVQRMRVARTAAEPGSSRILDLLAQECALRARAGERGAGLALLAEAERMAPASLAVVRMRDTLALPQQGGETTPPPQK